MTVPCDLCAIHIYIAPMNEIQNRNVFGAFALMVSDEIIQASSSQAPQAGPTASALALLAHMPGLSIRMLSVGVGLSHAGTVRLVDRLATEGLIERRDHSSDGRKVIEWRGKPKVIRCDNGPEYISGALLGWAERQGIRIEHIQPGKPQQNAYVERYNRTVRYAWLARTLFDSIEQVQDKATRWLWTYNHERPNMALGGITPMQKLALAA